MEFTDYDTRLAAYAVLVDGDRILLSWFNGNARNAPCWTLPGGGVEFDEAPVEAVAREVLEETGYSVEVGALLAVDTFTDAWPDRPRPFKAVRVLYAATITSGELGTLEVDGTTDFARWVSFDELAAATERRSRMVDLAVSLAGA